MIMAASGIAHAALSYPDQAVTLSIICAPHPLNKPCIASGMGGYC